ncbi:MAG: hypothetical protein ACYCTE_13230 [Acidimicrobiales bacterium]
MIVEAKPWDETLQDGSLNPNSYAAMAAFGLAELAVESLHAAGERVTARSVHGLGATYAVAIARAQRELELRPSAQDGSHARLRGALRTSLVLSPPPFGTDEAGWATWVETTERRIVSIARSAVRIWESRDEEQPWLVLATPALESVG